MSENVSPDPQRADLREGEAPAEPEQPKRKHPVHGVLIDETNPTIVFDTICTKDRERWLATKEVHQVLREVWQESTAWLVGRYVILPDHIHLFSALGKTEVSYQNWVQFWKSQFTKKYRAIYKELPQPGRWQTDNWDSRLRNWQSYDNKWKYVLNNPVRHGLVERAAEWPFQGEIHRLSWD